MFSEGIFNVIVQQVIIGPPEPVKEQPKGSSPEAIEDSKERNKILYESALKKWDKRIDNLDKNLLKVCSMIWDKFTFKNHEGQIGAAL